MTSTTGTERAGSNDLRVAVTVKAPIDRAFQVFTERMDTWWPRAHGLGKTPRVDVLVEPRVGGRWYERTADGTEHDWGRVLVWEAPHHVVFSWQIGVGFVPQLDPERASRVDVRFVADDPGTTTVTLVHSNFERHGDGWESLRDAVGTEGGWPGILRSYAGLAGS